MMLRSQHFGDRRSETCANPSSASLDFVLCFDSEVGEHNARLEE